jgi:NAD(P)-dependent dehydrogenase (short-subunit alcohol dehydrogenase family)
MKEIVMTEPMLQNKIAVIYGAGGAIGGAVARAFARDGARLFLTGRLRAPVEAVARDIVSARSTRSTSRRWTNIYSR